MDDISPEFIERYQNMLEKDPKSKVFAPLAEAYRKKGLASRAFQICSLGIEHNPNFAGGHISMGKALVDLGEPQKAIEHLEKATELAPENIMAYQVLADLLVKNKLLKEALKAYKMVLFLSPNNVKAQKAVKKLESLSAADFSDNIFPPPSAKPQAEKAKEPTKKEEKTEDKNDAQQNRLDRFISLFDAYIIRNNHEKAEEVFEEARFEFGDHPELKKRLKVLRPQLLSQEEEEEQKIPKPSRREESLNTKASLLRSYLLRINKRRKDKIAY